jgi:thiol-disulfide isomerase/thioredoxin
LKILHNAVTCGSTSSSVKGADMATVKVDINNFQSEVLESAAPVVVDFWAEWCDLCKMIAPSLEEISVEMEGKIKVAKLNIDENPEIGARDFQRRRGGRFLGRRQTEDSSFELDFERCLIDIAQFALLARAWRGCLISTRTNQWLLVGQVFAWTEKEPVLPLSRRRCGSRLRN